MEEGTSISTLSECEFEQFHRGMYGGEFHDESTTPYSGLLSLDHLLVSFFIHSQPIRTRRSRVGRGRYSAAAEPLINPKLWRGDRQM